MNNARKCLTPLLLGTTFAFLAAGCGGGSSSVYIPTAPVSSTATFQTRTAWANWVANASSLPFTITGTYLGAPITGNGTTTWSGLVSSTFEGQSALVKVTQILGSYTASGTVYSLHQTTANYYDSNYNPLGSSDGYYEVVNPSTVNIPTTSLVNDTGILYSGKVYSDISKTTQTGTDTVTYTLKPDTATTALLLIASTVTDMSGAVHKTDSSTFRITTAGGITPVSETSTGGNLTLNLAY
jgi:hypothetical protein